MGVKSTHPFPPWTSCSWQAPVYFFLRIVTGVGRGLSSDVWQAGRAKDLMPQEWLQAVWGRSWWISAPTSSPLRACVGALLLYRGWLFATPWTGSSVHGISQARILEWVAISSPRGSSQARDWNPVSCISCIGRRILHCWAAWGALLIHSVGQSQDVSLSHSPVMFPGVTSPVNRASKSLSLLLGKPQARDPFITCLLLAVKGESTLRIIFTGWVFHFCGGNMLGLLFTQWWLQRNFYVVWTGWLLQVR